MTYNNCEYITDLYKDFKIIETSWSYGMNKSKKSLLLVKITIYKLKGVVVYLYHLVNISIV